MCNLMHIGGPDKTLKHTCTIIVFGYCSIVNLIGSSSMLSMSCECHEVVVVNNGSALDISALA